jgi:hypothetical protein
MKKIYALVLFMAILVGYISSQQISEDAIDIGKYSEHLMHYFENKNDAIIFETVSIYKNEDNIGMLDRIDSIILFFFIWN